MHSPLAPTACSSPTNDSVQNVIKNDAVRYQRKGYGLIIAFIFLISYFAFFPSLLKTLWPYFLENVPNQHFLLILTLLFNTGPYVIANAVFYAIYKLKIPFFERYRVSDKPWPWESNPELWDKQIKKTLKALSIQLFLLVPVLTYIEERNRVMRIDLETFPELKEILGQLLFFMLFEDLLFYWGHRLLHHPKLYPKIHKIHHEFNVTVTIASAYSHIVEFFLTALIPTAGGAKLLGSKVHFATYIIWLVFRIMETNDGHCGYEFSWSPYRVFPLSGSSIYHEFHHSHNVGNFCSLFTFWDTLCGTNKHYFKYLAERQRKQLTEQDKNLTKKAEDEQNSRLAQKLEKNLGISRAKQS